jgi:hypothetical protein
MALLLEGAGRGGDEGEVPIGASGDSSGAGTCPDKPCLSDPHGARGDFLAGTPLLFVLLCD